MMLLFLSDVNAMIRNLPSGLKILKGLDMPDSPRDIQGQSLIR
jgi:hypothetical protein